jgi:hypothetical protein
MVIKLRMEDIDVMYDEMGKYYPATRDSPAEYPDLHITSIEYKGVDIQPILSDRDIDLVYELLIAELYG